MDHSEVKHLPKVDHTPAEMSEGARVLLRAAALIEEHGWVKGSTGHGAGRDGFCVNHALAVASGELGALRYLSDHQSYLRLYEVLGTAPSIWNDRTAKTKDEVVAKLRAVALGL